MSRYIDADLIEYEPMCRAMGNGMYEDCEIAHKDQIDDIPTADVWENVKGEWIYHKATIAGVDDSRECSVCGVWFDWTMPRNSYCPNCGADMRGEV